MSMTFLDSIQQLEKVFLLDSDTIRLVTSIVVSYYGTYLDLERVELATVVEQLLQVLIEIFED